MKTLVLVCANGHKRELPKCDDELHAAIERCVRKGVARCDEIDCRERIVRVEVMS